MLVLAASGACWAVGTPCIPPVGVVPAMILVTLTRLVKVWLRPYAWCTSTVGYVNARTPVGAPAGLAWVLGAAVAVGVFSTVGHTVAGRGACHVEVMMGTGATEG